MLDLKYVLRDRLHALEKLIEIGVIPGEIDTYEHHQTIGRAKELKFVLSLMEQNDREVI